MKTFYELRQFTKSSDQDLNEALTIYSQNIEPILRTDTKEIKFWVNKYQKKHKDQFILLGFYLNETIIGYAQLAYFIEEKILFVDYIVIDKPYRRGGTFHEFIDQIREFILANNIIYDFIVAEVGAFDNSEPSQNTRQVIKLLKGVGFGVLKTTYYHPQLGKLNYESQLKSILMIYTDSEMKVIKKETYILIIKTIYFKHYKRWYDEFLNEFDRLDYFASLNTVMVKTEQDLKKKSEIAINGLPNSFLNGWDRPIPIKYSNIAKALGIAFLSLVFIISFGFIHRYVKDEYNIDTTAQTSILILSGVCILFIVALITEGRTQTITGIIEKILNKLT